MNPMQQRCNAFPTLERHCPTAFHHIILFKVNPTDKTTDNDPSSVHFLNHIKDHTDGSHKL